MTKDEKIGIIRGEGFTEYQAETIYDEMNVFELEDEELIIDVAQEWYQNEKSYERTREY